MTDFGEIAPHTGQRPSDAIGSLQTYGHARIVNTPAPNGGMNVGLFDGFKGKSAGASDGIVYLFTLKIKSGETQIPAPMTGAYVVAYCIADTPENALKKAWRKLEAMGYFVEDANLTGGSLSISDWDTHVSERWPEFIDHFPSQKSLVSELAERNAILSPFAAFE